MLDNGSDVCYFMISNYLSQLQGIFMIKRFLFFCLTLLFFISATSNVSADNKIIRKKTIRNATITAGNRLTVFAKGKTINTKIMDGGIEDVFVGAVSQNAKVFKGGRLWLAGGKSYGAVVHNGGLMEVREHDKKSSYSRDTKLLSGGRMNVFNHSLSEKITVGSNGFLRVYFPGAVISDVTILSGGLVHVWKHGTAQNVYVAPGGVLELREESPVLKGTIRVAGQLKASFDHNPDVSQAKIILDLTQRREADVYYIKNLDFLKNSNISVNIAHNQKTGSYKIASGATRWNDKLDITVDGQKIQSIRLWKPVKIAGKYYTLKRVNYKFIELTVSLTPPASIDKNKPSGRLNSENPKKTLDAILTSIQTSKELSDEHKQILRSCLTALSQTPTGRYIFSNIPYNITLHIIPNPKGQGALGTYNHGHRKACFSDYLLRRALSADTEVKKQEKLLRFTTVIAHELTHATQEHLELGICPGASYEDYATLRKFTTDKRLFVSETELFARPSPTQTKLCAIGMRPIREPVLKDALVTIVLIVKKWQMSVSTKIFVVLLMLWELTRNPLFSETARLPLLICLFPPESSDMLTVSERWKWTF